jgi:replicative DNA helicase
MEYEKTLLNICLFGGLEKALAEGITAEIFFDQLNMKVFQAIMSVYREGNTLDVPTVGSRLSGIENAMSRLVEVYGEGPSTQNQDYWLRVAKNASKRTTLGRRMKDLLIEASRAKPDEDYDLEAKIVTGIVQQYDGGKVHTMDNGMINRVIDRLEEDATRGGVVCVKTGIPSLDHHLGGGLKPGKLVTLAARPGVGKTALATNIALRAAKDGFTVLYITIELTADEVLERLFATEGEINVTSLANRNFSSEDFDKIAASGKTFASIQNKIIFSDKTDGCWDLAETQIKLACRCSKANLVVIDYIQQFSTGNYKTAREDLTGITARCKQLALAHQTCILMVAQLNREVEKRGNGEPLMSDLKESGSIEQDSDAVLLMYREESQNVTNIRIAKNRQGRIGTIKVKTDLSINKFFPDKVEETAGETVKRVAKMGAKGLDRVPYADN